MLRRYACWMGIGESSSNLDVCLQHWWARSANLCKADLPAVFNVADKLPNFSWRKPYSCENVRKISLPALHWVWQLDALSPGYPPPWGRAPGTELRTCKVVGRMQNSGGGTCCVVMIVFWDGDCVSSCSYTRHLPRPLRPLLLRSEHLQTFKHGTWQSQSPWQFTSVVTVSYVLSTFFIYCKNWSGKELEP